MAGRTPAIEPFIRCEECERLTRELRERTTPDNVWLGISCGDPRHQPTEIIGQLENPPPGVKILFTCGTRQK